jgi:superoxide reductase
MSARTACAVAILAVLSGLVTPAMAGAAPARVGELYKTDDWAVEKHVPVIDCPDVFASGEPTVITVTVGKEIHHPNTTAHHISWIRLYFLPEGSQFAQEIASFELSSHGASVDGPDTSTLYAAPTVTVEFMTEKPGMIYATSYCNIHGLWDSSKAITVR